VAGRVIEATLVPAGAHRESNSRRSDETWRVHTKLARLLRARGADPSRANSDGTAARMYALQQGNVDVTALVRVAIEGGSR